MPTSPLLRADDIEAQWRLTALGVVSDKQLRRSPGVRLFQGLPLPGGGSADDAFCADKQRDSRRSLCGIGPCDLLMRQRAQLIDAIRVHMAELGIRLRKGRTGSKELLAIIADEGIRNCRYARPPHSLHCRPERSKMVHLRLFRLIGGRKLTIRIDHAWPLREVRNRVRGSLLGNW